MVWVAGAFAAGIGVGWRILAVLPAIFLARSRAVRVNLALLVLMAVLGAARAAVDRMPATDGIARWMDDPPRPGAAQRRVAASPPAPAALQGLLLEEPEFIRQGRDLRGWLRIESIRGDAAWISCSGKVQVHLPASAGLFLSGEKIRAYGLLRSARGARPDSHSRFDEQQWLWLHGAAGVLSIPSAEAVTCVGWDRGLWFRYRRWVDRFRRNLKGIGRLHLDSAEAGFLEALLLGESHGVPRPDWEAFRRTGTVHVLVVSGLHVGLIGGICLLLLTAFHLPRTVCYLLLGGILTTYCLLTGMNPPIVRSTVSGLLLCWAKVRGIDHSPLNLIGTAAVVILAAGPRALAAVSFQLSFAAVGAVIAADLWVAGKCRKIFLGPLARAAAVSIAAWLATLPILARQFSGVSLLAPLVNLIVVPWASCLVAGGFLVYLAGWLSPTAAAPFAAAFGGASRALVRLVGGLASLPGSYWSW